MKEKFDRNKPRINIGTIGTSKTPSNVTDINQYKKLKRTREFLEQQRTILGTLKNNGLVDTTSFEDYKNIDCNIEETERESFDINKVNYYSNSKSNINESDNTHQDYSITRRALNEDDIFVPINEAQKPKKR